MTFWWIPSARSGTYYLLLCPTTTTITTWKQFLGEGMKITSSVVQPACPSRHPGRRLFPHRRTLHNLGQSYYLKCPTRKGNFYTYKCSLPPLIPTLAAGMNEKAAGAAVVVVVKRVEKFSPYGIKRKRDRERKRGRKACARGRETGNFIFRQDWLAPDNHQVTGEEPFSPMPRSASLEITLERQ